MMHCLINAASSEMMDADLVMRIAGRRVIVDACVSRDLANSLKRCGLVVRHVADINAKLTDPEIAALMHTDEVLVTRDYRFYKMLGKEKAILLSSKSNNTVTTTITGSLVEENNRRTREKKRKLPSHIRIALKQKLAEEAKAGTLYMKILWCICWLVLPITT